VQAGGRRGQEKIRRRLSSQQGKPGGVNWGEGDVRGKPRIGGKKLGKKQLETPYHGRDVGGGRTFPTYLEEEK